MERDKHRCLLCRGKKRLTLHHVIPLRDGGGNEAKNLATLCEFCHRCWHRCERHKVGLNFFDWLAGGARREKAFHRCILLKEMVVLRFSGESFETVSESLNHRDIKTLSGKRWTPGNVRNWLLRNAPFDYGCRNWRLIKWPYYAEPITEKNWRSHRLDTPLGVCLRGRRRLFTMRYDFVHLTTRVKDLELAVLRNPYGGVLIHRTERNLQGSKSSDRGPNRIRRTENVSYEAGRYGAQGVPSRSGALCIHWQALDYSQEVGWQ